MQKVEKVKSVLELSKYQIGDVLYWVVLRPIGVANIIIDPENEWLLHVHPKVMFDRGIAIKSWKFKESLPRLCAADFHCAVNILTSEPVAERFEVLELGRSNDTGDYYYQNQHGEWMVECYLFKTAKEARREKIRVKDLFAKWAKRESPDEV